jgi:hypothetical protein
MHYLRLLGALGSACLAAGCGLISSDVTNFDLTLPDKNFTIDATSWQVDQTQASQLLAMSCTGNSLCDTAAQAACSMGCSGECKMSKCVLHLEFSAFQAVNLLMEKPELKSINDEPVIKVSIDSVTYEVTNNSLNVETPRMDVFVAPMSVMDPTDPMAKQIGTIDGIAPGVTTNGPQTMTFTDTGKADLVNIMSTFKTPFNLIVGSTPPGYTVDSTTPVPQGKLDAVVHVKAHAGL